MKHSIRRHYLLRKGRAVRVLMLLFLAMLGFISAFETNSQSQSQPPEGLLEQPRLRGFNINPSDPKDRDAGTAANLDKEFTFTGWVDFPPGDGELWVYVGCDGDSYPGNGQLRIRIAYPSSTTKTVDGRTVWTFSIGPFKPFQEAVNNDLGIWCGRPWQDGGTVRVGIIAYRYHDGASNQLSYLDRDGTRLEFHDLIFADHSLTPATQNQYYTPLYAVPAYLGKKDQTGTPDETQIYYESVSVDENGSDPTQTIWTELQHLKDFKKRYFDSLSSCSAADNLAVDDSPAIYFNKGDLGIGREMHCSYNGCTQETACYVKNYGKPDGSALFTSDKTSSKQAIDANKPFATVAMVSRGKMPANAPNKVFFAVYFHTGRYDSDPNPLVVQDETPLGREAQLDNRAHNKFIPGNCLVCHGAQARYSKDTQEVFIAYFLPFDLQHAFDYYGTGLSNPLSRAAQEATFKKLNQIVAKTDLYSLENAKALLNGFYGAPQEASDPDTWPSSTFTNDWVPSNNWNASDDARQIYRKVVAPYCRTCHVSHPSMHFGNWDDFLLRQFESRAAVCRDRDQNIMPNAEATSKAFWRSDARAQFVSRMNSPGCGLEPYE
jgi:hypothetical protein